MWNLYNKLSLIFNALLWVGGSFRGSCVGEGLCESLGSVLQDVDNVWLHVGQGLLCKNHLQMLYMHIYSLK